MNFGFNLSTNTTKGMDPNKFSVTRAVQILSTGQALDGYEAEWSAEHAPKDLTTFYGRGTGGFFCPLEAFAPATYKRDLNVTTASQGGNLVQGTVSPVVIDYLRAKVVTARLGVNQVFGLKGSGVLPRATGTSTAYSVSENGTLTRSTPTVDNISATPKRIGASSAYSKEMLLMTPVAIDTWLRDELFQTLATKIDYNVLQGTGANTPTGILHTNGIGSVTFGAAATHDKTVEFEAGIGAGNADVPEGKFAWLVGSSVRKKWRTLPKTAATGTNDFLWTGAGDGSADGRVLEYPAIASNQVDNDRAVFANWADSSLLWWGPAPGIELTVNPYSLDTDATVKITLNAYCDLAVHHAVSFVWSTDSAIQ